ncbi:hypothetical protein CONPUDRAFT_148018 [Coniophora puteana RWD-64-598 SS2]|uniref:Uncharacterized protein n=1 Tax=Coniophora puteana (strain RWD-64-598) TaxID=741705 RepID=A0A5M3N3E8_CONPW|nr:uncharacterized protein CONPUDRAFT_148018 [Coniophora puteana RWD-64-598 SS2]EIW85883.1 hypothetical protein CONPUDRAFT_148018 [Coniophora puteana RWD-64-598 SS2]
MQYSVTATFPSGVRKNCFALYKAIPILGNSVVWFATVNFVLRAWLIWDRCWPAAILFSLMSGGHAFILMYAGALRSAKWSVNSCTIVDANHISMGIAFIYTMAYDFLVLILTVVGLSRLQPSNPLGAVLRRQGVMYVATMSVVNVFPAVFYLLYLNDVMTEMTGPPATTLSMIISSRAVMSLIVDKKPEQYSSFWRQAPIGDTEQAFTTRIGEGVTTFQQTFEIDLGSLRSVPLE